MGLPVVLLSQLRDATRMRHEQIERHPLFAPLTAADLTIQRYRLSLLGLRRFFAGIEPWILHHLPAFQPPDHYRYTPRTPLLTQDLLDLDTLPRLSPTTAKPELGEPAGLPGVLYVVEGATQGGRVILPQLARQVAIEPPQASRYFGLHQRAQWPAYRAWLLAAGVSWSQPQVLDAACRAFEQLQRDCDAILCASHTFT